VCDALDNPALDVVRVPEIRERDFGPWEGKKFGSRIEGLDEVSLSGAETRAHMAGRVSGFVDTLEALGVGLEWEGCVAIVAHGIILSILVRALAVRFPGGSASVVVSDAMHWGDHSISFRNTGYLEATVGPATSDDGGSAIRLSILAVNSTTHLEGLKKTRGGIGSAKFDDKQKTLDAFFKPSLGGSGGGGSSST
jgi:hypothetical protein